HQRTSWSVTKSFRVSVGVSVSLIDIASFGNEWENGRVGEWETPDASPILPLAHSPIRASLPHQLLDLRQHLADLEGAALELVELVALHAEAAVEEEG